MASTTFKVTNQSNHKISSKHKHDFNEGSCPTALYQITAVSWYEYFTSSNIRTYKYSFYFYGDSNSSTLGPFSRKINSNGGAVNCNFSADGLSWARTVVTGTPGIYCSQSNSSLDSEAYWRGTSDHPTVVTFTYTAYGNVSVGSLSLSAGIGSMTLSWGAGSGGTGTSVANYTYGYGASGASSPAHTWNTSSTSATITGLSQNTTYTFFVKANSSPSGHDSAYKSKSGTTDYYGTLPNPSISVSVSGTSATVSASGTGGHNTSVASYSYGYATSGSSPTTTGGPTFTGLAAGTTYYFFARSNSSPSGYNSSWVKSSAYTIGSHPSVAAGNVITKGQMDTLRSWKSNSPTAVSQGGIIYASTANTYRSASAGGSITASWYNGA